MGHKLYTHQEEAVDFILSARNALLWHEVGLGKTLSAITAARVLLARIKNHLDPAIKSSMPKVLIVLPKGLMAQWRSEVYTLAPDMSSQALYLPYSQIHKAKALIMYYDIRVLIFDESHYLKTMGTQRLTKLREMLSLLANSVKAFRSGKVIKLTGTPIPNSAAEMYTTWALLGAPSLEEAVIRLGDKKRYMEWVAAFTNRELKKIPSKFTKPKLAYGAPKGVANEDKLMAIIKPFTHYRTAAQCLELPESQEILIDLGLGDDKLFENANIDRPEHYMAQCEKLARAKTPAALEWIEDFLENSPGERLIVFSPYVWPLDQIINKFEDKVSKVIGAMDLKSRSQSLANYNSLDKPIIIGTYGAMSTGYNLQAGCKTLYLGYPWSPKTISQAKGRTVRSGQKNRTLHFFLMSGENDKKVLRDLRRKEKGIAKVETRLMTATEIEAVVSNLI